MHLSENLSALLHVLALAIPAFAIARVVAGPTLAEEFTIWRNCWFATTIAVFLSGYFLLFAALLGLIAIYAHYRGAAPALVYIALLFACPSIPVTVEAGGIVNKLVDIDPQGLLGLFFLLPAAFAPKSEAATRPGLRVVDWLVFALFLIKVLLTFRVGGPTHVLRMAFSQGVVLLLPYFVLSRSLLTTADIRKALMAFVTAGLPLAFVGLLEMAKNWRTYNTVAEGWGVSLISPYLFRDGMLRAAATAIEPIAFGFACMVAAGCLLAMRCSKPFRTPDYLALGVLLCGLLASLSRGPWLGFALLMLWLTAVRPQGVSNVVRVSLLAGVVALPVLMTSFGARFLNLLPFVGTVETDTGTYRYDLLNSALLVIGRNPLFGSADFLAEPEMQRMLQGQGIVDVVNTYLQLALEYGLVTLLIFVAIFALIGARLLRLSIFGSGGEQLYAACMAILVAILFTIFTVSSVSFIPYIYWAFAGLCVALVRTGVEPAEQPMRVVGQPMR